jgi:hypothetical protein
MSELKSLYVRISTSKANLDRFFQDKPAAVAIDQNWLSWWDSRGMYSKSTLTEIPVYSSETNRAILASYLEDPQAASHEFTDDEQGVWTFCSIFFTENYFEMLPMLALFKNMAAYLDAEDEGVVLVYDYFWGDETVMAHMLINGKQALLKETSQIAEIEAAVIGAAKETLDKTFDIVGERYGD